MASGLLKVDLPELQSSHMFSPDRPEAVITSTQNSVLQVFLHYLLEGVWHIWIGIDHILFLLSLLVLAPLQAGRSRVTQWPAVPRARTAVMEVLAVVTAFTLAHSITLGASVLKWLEPSPHIIEPAIAITVVLVALNNLLGWSAVKRWPLAFAFGLIHGFGFANVLLDLGLPTSSLVAATHRVLPLGHCLHGLHHHCHPGYLVGVGAHGFDVKQLTEKRPVVASLCAALG